MVVQDWVEKIAEHLLLNALAFVELVSTWSRSRSEHSMKC